jgi:hypothetical protein
MDEAKLSTKQRKKLPAKAFCGPKRSFPANDCKHVKAGLSLLGRYKGPGSKASIRACLYRKARSMNCFKTGKGAKNSSADISLMFEALYMYKEGTLGFDGVSSVVVDVCEQSSIGKAIMATILKHIKDGDLNSALSTVISHTA